MMFSSQCSAQSVAILSGETETETKRIVPLRGSASGSDPPKIIAGGGTPPPDKNPTERNITSYLQGAGRDPGYWPVISLLAPVDDVIQKDWRTQTTFQNGSWVGFITWRSELL